MFWHIQAIFRSLLMSYRALLPSNHNQMQHLHLHFESPCFVCAYTSFTFSFYQSCAAVFAQSTFFIMAHFQGVAVSPRSLSEASSVVFVAFTFALLGFCISGIFGFAMQCVLHIYIILDLYLFLEPPFCCSVFWGTVMITYQLLCQALFCWLNCSGLQCFLQCNVMCCSALQCSLQSFHCSLLTFLIFLFYSVSGHSLYIQIPVLNI